MASSHERFAPQPELTPQLLQGHPPILQAPALISRKCSATRCRSRSHAAAHPAAVLPAQAIAVGTACAAERAMAQATAAAAAATTTIGMRAVPAVTPAGRSEPASHGAPIGRDRGH